MVSSLPAETGSAGLPILDRDAFLAAMRCVASTVSVVTVATPEGRLGVTVSSLVSISADPPLFSVCINRRSPVCAALQDADLVSVHVLADGQHGLANHFAGRPAEGAGYGIDAAAWIEGPLPDEPALQGAALSICGRIAQRVPAGSHCLFIIAACHVADGGQTPLLYWDRGYTAPMRHGPTT